MNKRHIKLSDSGKGLSQFIDDLKNDVYIINKESLVIIARIFNGLVESNPQDTELKTLLIGILRELEKEVKE